MSQSPRPGHEVRPFELPLVEGAIVNGGDPSTAAPTVEELGEVHRQAFEEGRREGFDSGFADGLQQGVEAAEQQLQLLRGIVSDLAQPLAQFDDDLTESVAELALLIARHLVRRELKTAPGEVVGVVRESLKHLPIASRRTTIRLNPDDVDLVRDAMSLGEDIENWRIDPDPLIARGGCVLESETSRVDATVESRLAAIASQMFGGERDGDRAE